MLIHSIEPHPDELSDKIKAKEIKQGSMQALDNQAMEAMWQAIERGESREEANKIFSQTYQQFICASKETNAGY